MFENRQGILSREDTDIINALLGDRPGPLAGCSGVKYVEW